MKSLRGRKFDEINRKSATTKKPNSYRDSRIADGIGYSLAYRRLPGSKSRLMQSG